MSDHLMKTNMSKEQIPELVDQFPFDKMMEINKLLFGEKYESSKEELKSTATRILKTSFDLWEDSDFIEISCSRLTASIGGEGDVRLYYTPLSVYDYDVGEDDEDD